MIYHIKALTIELRTTLKNFEKISPVSRKTSVTFSFTWVMLVHFEYFNAFLES